jgi:hypothetical protein
MVFVWKDDVFMSVESNVNFALVASRFVVDRF